MCHNYYYVTKVLDAQNILRINGSEYDCHLNLKGKCVAVGIISRVSQEGFVCKCFKSLVFRKTWSILCVKRSVLFIQLLLFIINIFTAE